MSYNVTFVLAFVLYGITYASAFFVLAVLQEAAWSGTRIL